MKWNFTTHAEGLQQHAVGYDQDMGGGGEGGGFSNVSILTLCIHYKEVRQKTHSVEKKQRPNVWMRRHGRLRLILLHLAPHHGCA